MNTQETVQINIRLPKKVAEKLDTLSIIAGKKRPKYVTDHFIDFVNSQFPVMIWHPGTEDGKPGVYSRQAKRWLFCETKEDAIQLAIDLNRKTGIQ